MTTPHSTDNRSGGDPARRGNWLPLAVFGAIIALLAAGVWLSRNPDREALPSPLIGRTAPAFELPLLHDPARRFGSQELAGEPYLLNVWGSWCPGCRDEHPVVAALADSGRVRVVGYNWKDQPDDALRWLQHFGDPYHLVVADMEGRTAIEWGIYGAPETFLVDASGTVRWKHVGPLTEAVVRDELSPLLDQLGNGK